MISLAELQEYTRLKDGESSEPVVSEKNKWRHVRGPIGRSSVGNAEMISCGQLSDGGQVHLCPETEPTADNPIDLSYMPASHVDAYLGVLRAHDAESALDVAEQFSQRYPAFTVYFNGLKYALATGDRKAIRTELDRQANYMAYLQRQYLNKRV